MTSLSAFSALFHDFCVNYKTTGKNKLQLNALGINKVGNHKVKHSFWNKLLEGSKTFSSSVKGGRSLRDEVLLGDLPHPNYTKCEIFAE